MTTPDKQEVLAKGSKKDNEILKSLTKAKMKMSCWRSFYLTSSRSYRTIGAENEMSFINTQKEFNLDKIRDLLRSHFYASPHLHFLFKQISREFSCTVYF